MIPAMPAFTDFYRQIHGRDPFPWQDRLGRRVAETGCWPDEIGVPTGLGKTACLDIAVWWLASQADREAAERTAPTRIWWVVNRRLLVDSTAEHARSLAGLLAASTGKSAASPEKTAVAAVANRLNCISASSDATPLEVISLRGGLSSRTPVDPSKPAVILCTLPMYGSRFLFRGYGSRLRAVDAAMAGADSLVLLDEAHLAPHLKSLMGALEKCTPGARPPLNATRSKASLVALTATGEADGARRFDLDEADNRNDEVARRLDAAKPLEVRVEKTGDIGLHLCDATLDLLHAADEPGSFLVFANTPKTARDVHRRLAKSPDARKTKAEVLLLTGLVREREAESTRKKILDPADGMPAARNKDERERHLVVVATQTLEVGADLDAEFLVTEACGVRALTQRLGRLNRLGRHPRSKAIYVHAPPKKSGRGGSGEFWPVYGEEPAIVLERLQQAPKDSDGMVDLRPRWIADTLGRPGDDPGRAPEVLPGILWEWVKTTTPPEGEAPVEPYFSGIKDPVRTVAVIWRAHVPAEGGRLWPRPIEAEAVDVGLGEFRDAAGDGPVLKLGTDGVTGEQSTPSQLKPGDRIILPSDRGLLDGFGWNSSATKPVVDVSLARKGLPLDAKAINRLCGDGLGPGFSELVDKAVGSDTEEIDEDEREIAIAEILGTIQNLDAPTGWDDGEWSGFTHSLKPEVVAANKEVPRLPVGVSAEETPVAEFDETSLVTSLGDLSTLCGHGGAVGRKARSVAERTGLPKRLVEVIQLAGDLHDIGKADYRFQRWLDPDGQSAELMAKSDTPRHRWASTRAAAGWPRGGRHEALSARLAEKWLESNPDWGSGEERDLLLHLIISHHGKGRPMVLPVRDGTPDRVSVKVVGSEIGVSADLSVADWAQPERFRRLNERFGPWGLALLEAIIIRSDHAVSRETDLNKSGKQ